MKLRIKFRKYGAVRYIGHLDVMRFFQKAIRRAGIDVKYSNGFSPHQIMTFASPLGVGITSNGEYMDIEVHSLECIPSQREEEKLNSSSPLETAVPIPPCENILNRLNKASVPGIEIVSVKILPDTAGNAMASVAAASYTVRFRDGREPRMDISAVLPGFLAKEQICVTKKTKKGVREVDLKAGIFQLTCRRENIHSAASHSFSKEMSPSSVILTMLLDASSGGNLKPVQVVEALLAEAGEKLQENALSVTREDVYTRAEDGELISLNEVGAAYPSA